MRAIVTSVLPGFSVSFCLLISQVIGRIVAQFSPVGQHNTVVFAARGMQAWFAGQQKDDGNPGCVQCEKLGCAQVEALSRGLSEGCAAVDVAEQTAARSRGLDVRTISPPDRWYC